ncbi:hypothetical protein VA7868_02283 [Vibrio aerogenes CECT 7868]|uniref:Uncharacterized protein n=1 Tax=Vibrio aerogenes CECT 7868 TaxID=1216006 RepID=A0A1M5Z5J6_9VIBR|nr:hypothetical protein [Vibrio aerogenes]SHI19163.1 hypothetical protein VA7868_02283 [Vibrio aerogenes CECT 7868]
MQKTKAISLILLGVLLTLAGHYLLQPEVNLDKQVFNKPISETLSVVGYRNNTGNATAGFSYFFYVMSQGDDLPEPFLVTDTPEIQVTPDNHQAFTLTVKGKVYQFTNLIWVKEDGKLVPVSIMFKAENEKHKSQIQHLQ